MTTARHEPVWSTPPLLPRLDGDRTATMCVVGLGASGLSAVLEARQRGIDVVAIDAVGIAAGAAGRNGGFLLAGLAAFHHEAVARLGHGRALRAYHLTMDELVALQHDDDIETRFRGSVRIATSQDEEADCAAMLTALRSDLLPAEPYDGPEGRGVLVATDGVCDPVQRAAVLARRALTAGASLFGGTRATAIAPGRVDTPAGTIHCDRVVVAVDGGLETTLPELRGRVRTARLQMLATAPATDVRVPRPVYARYGFDYWQQLPDGRLALGGCRDRGGDGEWTAAAVPTETVQSHLDHLLRNVVGTRAAVTHRWAGAVAFTDDHLPVLEEVRPRVIASGAYSGTGNVVGALCGRAAVALAFDGQSDLADLLRSG
jgi:glycine/D-amino acid oxidase-like deaminating enzyme